MQAEHARKINYECHVMQIVWLCKHRYTSIGSNDIPPWVVKSFEGQKCIASKKQPNHILLDENHNNNAIEPDVATCVLDYNHR